MTLLALHLHIQPSELRRFTARELREWVDELEWVIETWRKSSQ